MHALYRGGNRGTGSECWSPWVNRALRDSQALPVEPSRTTVALIQWFPNACDREPFLAEPLLVLGAEAHSLGTQSSCPGLRRARGTPWFVHCCQYVEGEASWGQASLLRPLVLLPSGEGEGRRESPLL